jgi:hypothetical protein
MCCCVFDPEVGEITRLFSLSVVFVMAIFHNESKKPKTKTNNIYVEYFTAAQAS